MPYIPRKGTPKPWLAKRKTFAGNAGEDSSFYNSRDWRKLRLYILAGEPICRECTIAVANVVDHITPIRLGGSKWNHENLQPMCASCHNKKSSSERSSLQQLNEEEL